MTQNRYIAIVVAAICLLSLAACGGGGGGGSRPTIVTPAPEPTPPRDPTTTPAFHLNTARFTTHQPKVLEQIGAHHAYARGLTGRGVRIGIDDSIVDYTQNAEFGGRVRLRAADGASLAYARPDGDLIFSDVGTCRLFDPTCNTWVGNSAGDPEAVNSWVRQIVDTDGWPTSDDSVFVVDEYYDENDLIERLLRWTEVPTPYGQEGSHGTIVASVAAGENLGVAPGSTIIPIAQNLSDDQRTNAFADETLRRWISVLPVTARSTLDDELASTYRDNYAKFDIINRSYGAAVFDPNVISSEINSELRWYRRYLPQTLRALLQIDTPASEKTILVYAAGNEEQRWSGIGADLPFYIEELRGHSLAVAATDPDTGVIADYSNRCGPLPSNWNAASHGPHYCLSAPGTVRGLVPNPNSPGNGNISDGAQGTSYAAPIVSGALALLMEHFRGTRGNTEVVKRMLDTADRSGRYANSAIYGAGHLDLEAALSPVGTLSVGQSARGLYDSSLQVPAIFGSITDRVEGLELTAFDEQNFPFWVPLSSRVRSGTAIRSTIPMFQSLQRNAAPAPGFESMGMNWTPIQNAGKLGLPEGQDYVIGFGPSSMSFARQPQQGGFGYGFSVNDGNYLGAQTSGAFGRNLRSGMVWTSHAIVQELGHGLTLNATGTVGMSLPDYEQDAIFQASSSLLSAVAIRVGTPQTVLMIEQPLRAETGTGTFRIENGRMENGRWLYDKYRIRLSPDAREVRLTLHHEREAVGGRIAVEAGSTMNAGHIPGRQDSRLGFAYRLIW
ncbi:MAG: S8 family serine peptidase [Nitrospira sp.]|nr:S8 family serine peptidase [Nitrospira sp.]